MSEIRMLELTAELFLNCVRIFETDPTVTFSNLMRGGPSGAGTCWNKVHLGEKVRGPCWILVQGRYCRLYISS